MHLFVSRGLITALLATLAGLLCAARPQDPVPPVPYQEVEVTYTNRDITLSGTLTLPPGPGPFPAVVLITGSGAQDRDEEVAGHRPFLILADHLTRSGMAVLRSDDRGIGGSTGSVSQSTTLDFAHDALAALDYLSSRADIDASRMGMLGHSEGGIVAPLAASLSPAVSFLILLAPPSVPGWEIILEQAQRIGEIEGRPLSEEQVVLLREALEIVVATMDRREMELALHSVARRQIDVAVGEAELPDKQKRIETAVAQSMTPWFVYFARLDPQPILESTTVPILALWGAMDVQVSPTPNLKAFAAALARSGNPDVTTRVFQGLNHLFQACRRCTPGEYGTLTETLNPEVLEVISRWTQERLRR